MSVARVAGIGVALPPPVGQDALWSGFFAGHFPGEVRALAQRIFANAGVRTRQAAVSPLVEDVTGWSTARRMSRYVAEVLPLGEAAARRALDAAGLRAADVGLFVVCSCTGYATPGLDIVLAGRLGLGAGAQRLFVGHMGCYAALPGLGAAADFVRARGRPALLLCAELTSLHAQPSTRDPQQIVAHALFSDAAAAAAVVPGAGPGYVVRDVVSITDPATADLMTWTVTDLGFRMGLSPKVPDVLADVVAELVAGLLSPHDLAVGDVGGWAVHPGGPRILRVVESQLGLSAAALAESREVLAAHGNCSSPTVLLVLDALTRSVPVPRHVVLLAFGPGLTLYAALLSAG
ncbi:MAG TPA: type III polyketide synthase [Pilimelia sp.]|nr:type III polyketide synthase [Pilimelia sp.]